MKRLGDAANILGTLILLAFGTISLVHDKTTPNWATPQLAIGSCGLAIILTCVALAIYHDWGYDKISKRINGVCSILVISMLLILVIF